VRQVGCNRDRRVVPPDDDQRVDVRREAGDRVLQQRRLAELRERLVAPEPRRAPARPTRPRTSEGGGPMGQSVVMMAPTTSA
jgi:hypothetical protein